MVAAGCGLRMIVSLRVFGGSGQPMSLRVVFNNRNYCFSNREREREAGKGGRRNRQGQGTDINVKQGELARRCLASISGIKHVASKGRDHFK